MKSILLQFFWLYGFVSGAVMGGGQSVINGIGESRLKNTIATEIGKNATLPNVVRIMGQIEGRSPDYYTSQEAIDTANAVLKMTNGTATKADYELIRKSEGARTVVLSAEGTKAWDNLKAEADKRVQSAEYGIRSESPETSGVKYKIAQNSKGKYVKASRQVIKGNNPKEWAGQVERYINDSIRKNKDVMFAGADGNLFVITTDTAGKARFRNVVDENGKKRRMTDSEYATKLRAETHIDELIQTSKTGKSRDDSKAHSFAKDGFNYRKAYFEDFDGEYYEVTISVGKNGIVNTVYNVGRLDKRTNPSYSGSKTNQKYSDHEGFVDKTRVAQKEPSVNSKDMHDNEIYSEGKKVTFPESKKKSESGYIVQDEVSREFRRKNQQGYDSVLKMARDLRKPVMFVEGLTDGKGQVLDGILTTEGIIINTKSENPLSFVATHEFSHWMKKKAPKEWRKYQKYVIDKLKNTYAGTEGVSEYDKKYAEKEGIYKTSEIDEEIACDYIGELFTDEKALAEFIKAERSFAVKIRDLWYSVLEFLGLKKERLDAKSLWIKAYKASMKIKVEYSNDTKIKGAKNRKTKIYDVETEQFAVDEKVVKTFGEKVDAWLRGEIKGDEYFELGDTPVVLRELGADNLPVIMTQKVMAKITGEKHSISLDEIKRLPEQFSNPIMVFKSETYPNAYVLLTEILDKKGHEVVAAVHLNKYEGRLRINRIASVYSRTNDFGKNKIVSFVENQAEKGNVVYIDKIKSQQWSTSRGLQLPKLVQSITDNNIILQKEDVVNKYSMQSEQNYAKKSVSGTRVSDNEASVENLREENARLRDNIEEKITVDMDEETRYEILKNKKITPTLMKVDESADIDFEYLEKNIKSTVEKELLKKFQSLGVLKKYTSLAVEDVYFDFTGKGFRKSLHSQENYYGGNKADFAKILLNLQNLLDSSILIETHTDKGKGTSEEKRGLERVYVLLSVMREGNNLIPVQFEVEQYVSNENRLYLAVALTKIETSVKGNTASDIQKATSLVPISNISISEIFSKINPTDKNFLKYIPNQFLNEEQIKAKNVALAIEKKKYSGVKKSVSRYTSGGQSFK